MKNEFKENLKDLIESLERFDGSCNEFIKDLNYPNFHKAIIDFCDEFNIELKETDIDVIEYDPEIDCDGIPYIDATVKINKLGLKLQVSSSHHRNWDFYIEGVKNLNNLSEAEI